MKSLLITIALIASTVSNAAYADCSLVLKAKKIDAKNARLDGVSFSAKQIAALKTICTVNIGAMSVDEQIADFKATLEKRMAKAAAAK